MWLITLRWRHNKRDGISNHRRLNCLLNRLFSSRSLAFVRKIHRLPVDSPHKGPVTRICFHLMTSPWCVFGNWHPGNHMIAPVPVTYERGTAEIPSVRYIVHVPRCNRWLITEYPLGVWVASSRTCRTNWCQTKIWQAVWKRQSFVFKFE